MTHLAPVRDDKYFTPIFILAEAEVSCEAKVRVELLGQTRH